MGDRLSMNLKERQRKVILESVRDGKLTLVEASKRLKLSYRQIKRVYGRYEREGDIGLIHGNLRKPSNRSYDVNLKKEILNLYRTKYEGFGPTFACEKLLKEGYKLSDET